MHFDIIKQVVFGGRIFLKKTFYHSLKSENVSSYLTAFENYGMKKKQLANADKFGFSSGTMLSDVVLLL